MIQHHWSETSGGRGIAWQYEVEEGFDEVGPQDYLQERFGLTAEHISRSVLQLVRK